MGKLIVQNKSAKLRQNRLRQWVLCLNDSSEILWCPFDSVQKSQIHGMIHCALAYRVPLNITMCAFETPQLTLRATCKRVQQFTMFRLFAWGEKFNWFQTLRNNSHRHATTCNRMCKLTQHVTSKRSFIDQSYFVKKRSTKNVKISLITYREHKKEKSELQSWKDDDGRKNLPKRSATDTKAGLSSLFFSVSELHIDSQNLYF